MNGRRSGANTYLQSAIVAVLLAPVLPDIFVDWWGGDLTGRDAWLRLAALRLVVVACFVVFRVRVVIARTRLAKQARDMVGNLDPASVLVVPLSLRRGQDRVYTATSSRTGPPEIVELLVSYVHPTTILGVLTPEIDQAALESIVEELADDGIVFVPVYVTSGYDAATLLVETSRVLHSVRELDATPDEIVVDVTAGTVAMSLAMMRVASELGSRCSYLTSKYRDGVRVAGTEYATQFMAASVIESTSAS